VFDVWIFIMSGDGIFGNIGRIVAAPIGGAVGLVAGVVNGEGPINTAQRYGSAAGDGGAWATGNLVAAGTTAVLTVPQAVMAVPRSLVRIGEMAVNGTFLESKQEHMDVVCAFCSADVYHARASRFQAGTINLPHAGNVHIQCVDVKTSDTDIVYAVYKINHTDLVVSFKGTDTLEEALTHDVVIAIASLRTFLADPLFPANEGFAQQACSQYTAGRIWFTGHSLGGSLAIIACMKNYDRAERCVVFNPGCGVQQNDSDMSNLWDVVKHCGFGGEMMGMIRPDQKKITAHHIFGDSVSFMCHGSDTTTVHTYRYNGLPSKWAVFAEHDVRNFLNHSMQNAIDNRRP
jgi:hypothetical protein